MKFKKILCFILSIIMAFSLGLTSFADNSSQIESDPIYNDILNASQRSLSKPTKYWELNHNPYKANLQLVSTSWLYTNYYFHCHSTTKSINVEGKVYSDTGRPTLLKIGLYSLTTNRFVDSYTVESSLQGEYFVHSFKGLTTTSKYAVAFIAHYDGFSHDSVHGWCEII